MRVLREKKRPRGSFIRAVFHDRLRDRKNVVLIERRVKRRPAMPAGTEAHTLRRVRGIRVEGIEVGKQAGQVHQAVRRGMVAGGVELRVRNGGGRHARKHTASKMRSTRVARP